jgi:hypothetical protein
MKIILFTNARDEKHIKEWVAHHLNLGFDFIHIFDHKSIDPIKDSFKTNPKLKIARIDNKCKDFKITLMMNAMKIAVKDSYDWVLYLDADEFLVLNKYNNVHDFINEYKDYNQVSVNWQLFGTSYLSKEPDGMILDNYLRCSLFVDKHVKSFVRPESVLGATTPHTYNTKDMSKSINSYTMKRLNNELPYFCPLGNKSYYEVSAYIAHYTFQAYDVYTSRKINFPRDDDNTYREYFTEDKIHLLHNDIVNISIRDKYSDKNAELIDIL